MMRKCCVCDGVEHTINTKMEKFVLKRNGKTIKYYHYQCYVNELIKGSKKQPKLSMEDAIVEADRLYNLYKDKEDLANSKDSFFQLIMTLYGQPLPNYFFIKIEEIINGTYKSGMPQTITYEELFEMYSNEKMRNKLDKIAFASKVEQDNRLYWDLAVMFNEYPNYVKGKKRAIVDSQETKQAIENINKYKINPSERYKTNREETAQQNKKSVRIEDLVDDILS